MRWNTKEYYEIQSTAELKRKKKKNKNQTAVQCENENTKWNDCILFPF